MRHFGIPLGLAALVHLLGLWGFPAWRALMIVPAATLFALLAVHDLRYAQGRVLGVLSGNDAPYTAWASAVLLVVSTALPLDWRGAPLWGIGALFAAGFFIAGIPQTWRQRERIDLAHVAWYTPALVAALNAPSTLPYGIRFGFGWAGFVGMAVVMLASAMRVVRDHDPQEMRSPWYGLGGSAVMALWALDALPGQIAYGVFLALCCSAAFWVFSVAHHRGWDSQGAWSNLFSLCSMAAVAIRIQVLPAAAALTVAAAASLALDLWRTTSPLFASRQAFRDTEVI